MPKPKPYTHDPNLRNRMVVATVFFKIPARENEPGDKPTTRYNKDGEERWQLWREVIGDPNRIKEEIKWCLEDEHRGICDFESVIVYSLMVI